MVIQLIFIFIPVALFWCIAAGFGRIFYKLYVTVTLPGIITKREYTSIYLVVQDFLMYLAIFGHLVLSLFVGLWTHQLIDFLITPNSSRPLWIAQLRIILVCIAFFSGFYAQFFHDLKLFYTIIGNEDLIKKLIQEVKNNIEEKSDK